MRAFVGVPVLGATVAPLLDLQAGIPLGRHVPEENLHLTLAFLDDCNVGVLGDVAEGLSAIMAPTMNLRLTHLDMIGGDRGPRLIAAMVAQDAQLTALRDRVRRIVQQAGVDLPRERFRPHVTLVRFGNRVAPDARDGAQRVVSGAGLLNIAMHADQMVLFQSTLTEDGPIYDSLAAFPLRP